MAEGESSRSLEDHIIQSVSREVTAFQQQSGHMSLSDHHDILQIASADGAVLSQPQESYEQLTSQIVSDSGHNSYSFSLVSQNATKSNIGSSVSTMQPSYSNKVAFLPVGNSGKEFFPVRMDHLVANLPLVAKKLATSRTYNSPPDQAGPSTAETFTLPAKKNMKTVMLMANNPTQSVPSAGLSAKKGSPVTEPDVSGTFNYYPVSSAIPSSSAPSVQSVTRPVYKSKLEKAMAQNLLKQNASKNSLQPGQKMPFSENTNHQPVSGSGNAVTAKQEKIVQMLASEIPVENLPVSEMMSVPAAVSSQASGLMALQVKSEASGQFNARYEPEPITVTKVAERYKDMVSRQTNAHQFTTKQCESIQFQTPDTVYVNMPKSSAQTFMYTPQTQFAYFHPSMQFGQKSELDKHSALVTEKVYSDASITRSILKYLWQLREDNQYCDAVIFTADEPVKLHKIVLLAASAEIQKKMLDVDYPDLKLVLPQGISSASVKTFVYYIYHGEIRLTVDNVQPLYRLSCIFGVDELGKFCYDFCKEAKKGDLIIASPYQEVVKPVIQEVPSRPEIVSNTQKSRRQSSGSALDADSGKTEMHDSGHCGPSYSMAGSLLARNSSHTTTQSQLSSENIHKWSQRSLNTSVTNNTTNNLTVQSSLETGTSNCKKPVHHVTNKDAWNKSVGVTTAAPMDNSQDSVATSSTYLYTIVELGVTDHSLMASAVDDKVSDAQRNAQCSEVNKAGVEEKNVITDMSWLEKNVLIDALDNDWMTSDPSQSNIPIRKRRRNRKDVANVSSLKSPGVAVSVDQQESFGLESSGFATKTTSEMKLNSNFTKGSDSASSAPVESTSPKQIVSKSEVMQPSQTKSVTSQGKKERNDAARGKRDKVVVHQVAKQIVELPDPLVTGKLDEDELNKLELVRTEHVTDLTSSTGQTKTVTTTTTRFRRRPNNMSVLEVASQKKAKSNDTSGVYTKQPAARSKRGKRSLPSSNSAAVQSLPEKQGKIAVLENLQLKAVESKSVVQGTASVVEKTKSIDSSDTTKNIASAQKSENLEDLNHTVSIGKQVINTDKIAKSLLLSDPGLDSGKAVTNERMATPPKKARFRKSALDQFDIKDKVYMRPPPKKRTKEIREMMKNEEDIKLTTTTDLESIAAISTSFNTETGIVFVEKENMGKKTVPKEPKKRAKRSRVKNEALMDKVIELDTTASKVSGEKLFRCCFCDSEFLFAKRAITHVVSTHEITLDDSVRYINVEDKNAPTKDSRVCDFCGYKTKECGVYYIHFHKYFRHGVPLPKGWKPFTCDLCKKEFFTKFQLREHKLIHFDDNPFVCNICGTGFKSRTCLNSHIFHKHNQVKRYKCTECPKSFKTRTQIKVHSRIHSGEKPFLCPVFDCVYRSTTRGNMKLHLSSKHKLSADVVKTYMSEQLEETVGGTEKEQAHYVLDSGTENTCTAVSASVKPVVRREEGNVALGMLVLPDVNEAVNMSGNDSFLQSNTQAINSETGQEFEMAIRDKAQTVTDIRDFGHLVQVAQAKNHPASLESQNISSPVSMLISDVNGFPQPPETDEQILNDLQRQDVSVNIHSQFSRHDQSALMQHYEAQTSDMNSCANSNGNEVTKLMDPHSREARMILKEALESHIQRPVARSSMLHNTGFDNNRVNVETRPNQTTQAVCQSPLSFHEADNLVIDLHDAANRGDEVLSIRNQIHQEFNHQFRERSDPSIIRDENVSELLQNIASSQHQSMEQGHFQVYHQQQTGSPTAYTSVVPVPDLDSRSAVPVATMTQAEGQGQSTHDPAMIQGQGYPNIPAHTSTSAQYGNDGTLYPSYYDIENY